MGRRYDTRALTDVLVRAAGDVRLEEPFREARILATGGFGARLARERGLLLRANAWSEGDGLDYGVARGAGLTAGLDEFYGRALPGQRGGERVRRPPRSSTRATRSCSTTRAATSARPPGTRAISSSGYPAAAPGTSSTRARSVSPCESERWPTWSRSRGRREATSGRRRSFRSPCRSRRSSPSRPFVAVRVYAAVTHTIGGLRIDDRARVLDEGGRPVPGLLAAGADAGGIFTGGYGSGLAAALVFGRIAAETALS